MVQTQSPNLIDVEINTRWQQFLYQKVNSFIKWDLVRFFHDNPHTLDTAENIAHFVGRDVATVVRELDGLVKADVLTKARAGKHSIYRLTQDETTRKVIHEFVVACHNREFRVKAINHVIHGMGYAARKEL